MNYLFKTSLFLLATCLFFFQNNVVQAQNGGLPTLDEGESIFVDGLSSNVLQRGQAEVNFSTSLYSQQLGIYASPNQRDIVDRVRLSESLTNIEAYYGMSESAFWDIGLRLRYARRRVDNFAQNSPFKVFGKAKDIIADQPTSSFDENYAGIKEIGLRLRLRPLVNVPQLSLNMGYSFAPNHEPEVQQHLNADRNSFDLNLAYYIAMNDNASSLYYFILNGTAYGKGTIETNNTPLYLSSASFIIVQRFGDLVFYPGISYTLGFKPPDVGDQTVVKFTEQVLAIVGLQYQINPAFNLNISSAIPLLMETPNLLQKPIRNSFSFVSLGARVLF